MKNTTVQMTVLKVSHQIAVLFDQSDVNRTLYTPTPLLLSVKITLRKEIVVSLSRAVG
jgi:hypothetical protein